MSDKIASFSTRLRYVAPGDIAASGPAFNIDAGYPPGGLSVGGIPISDGNSGFYEANFGDVTNATGFRVANTTGQLMDISINGSGCLFTMPPGATLTYSSPVHTTDGTWLQSIEVVVQDDVVGDQAVDVEIFGYADD